MVLVGDTPGEFVGDNTFTLDTGVSVEPNPQTQPIEIVLAGVPPTVNLRAYDYTAGTITPSLTSTSLFSSLDSTNVVENDGIVFRSPIPTNNDSSYRGREIAGLGSTITRLLFVGACPMHRTFIWVYDINTTATVQGQAVTSTRMSFTNIINEAGVIAPLPQGETPAVASLRMSGSAYQLVVSVTGHSKATDPIGYVTTAQESNAIIARCRGQNNYNQAIYNALADTYFTLPTINDTVRSYDLLNFPSTREIDVRAGKVVFDGGERPQLFKAVYERNDDAGLTDIALTSDEVIQAITVPTASAGRISQNSVRNSIGNPSVYSFVRELTAADIEEQTARFTALNTAIAAVQSGVDAIPTTSSAVAAGGLGFELSSDTAWDLESFVASQWVANPQTEFSLAGGARLDVHFLTSRTEDQFGIFTYEQVAHFTRAIHDDDELVFLASASREVEIDFRFSFDRGSGGQFTPLGNPATKAVALTSAPQLVRIPLASLNNDRPTRCRLTLNPEAATPSGLHLYIHEIKVAAVEVAEEVAVPTVTEISAGVWSATSRTLTTTGSGLSGAQSATLDRLGTALPDTSFTATALENAPTTERNSDGTVVHDVGLLNITALDPASGVAQGGVSVEVANVDGSLATIYSDIGLTEVVNPAVVDANGQVNVYVAPGRYNVGVTGRTNVSRQLVQVNALHAETAADGEGTTVVLRGSAQHTMQSLIHHVGGRVEFDPTSVSEGVGGSADGSGSSTDTSIMSSAGGSVESDRRSLHA